MIRLTIRLSNADKANVEIDKSSTVLELKEKINTVLNVPAAQQRLIHKGKVLKDDITLEHYGVEDEHTVHMVKGSVPATSSSTSTSNSNVTPSSTNNPSQTQTQTQANPLANSMGANAGLMNAMMMNPNMATDPQAMQQQLMQNPELMSSLMNSPMMENMMNNPDMMRNMMLNNPQMQSMMDANPHIRQVLNDPAVSRVKYPFTFIYLFILIFLDNLFMSLLLLY